MSASFPIKNGVLQGNLNAAGYKILNLDLTGLLLTPDSVGLGNVDDTSDLLKPLSTATVTALGLRELAITPGTTSQFWRGDKTWTAYGALALQDGATTLQELATIGPANTSSSYIRAKRNDFGSSSVATQIKQYGASFVGNYLSGIAGANQGLLEFAGVSRGVLNTTGSSVPIIFGTNTIERARLLLGLNIGATSDPGAGCLSVLNSVASATGSTTGNFAVGLNLTVGGSATIAGALTATSTLATGSNAAIAGNCVVSGFLTGSGNVNFTGLPTSDPHVVGRLWRNSSIVTVSAG